MNFAKASTILYPILGENVSDVILNYLKPSKSTIYDDHPNMYEYFKQSGMKYDIINEMYNYLEEFYSRSECHKSTIENRLCRNHPNECQIEDDHVCHHECDQESNVWYGSKFFTLVMQSFGLPDFIQDLFEEDLCESISNTFDEISIFEAFLLDFQRNSSN